ncbi:hypothetical protein [Blastomonas fulva]|uniref:hypothetical protein n=1 Tax=Blastomonas fulva TaxID=1550728 RepID=UPI0025A32A88|nr:hypothetical protein [Blastomonas fulva]MDM7966163.1 hypothetical protein [Blastomonas fulva]
MANASAPYYAMRPQAVATRPNSLFAVGGLGAAYLTFAALCTSLIFYGFVADLLGAAGETIRLSAIVATAILTLTGGAICLWRGKIFAAGLTLAGLFSIFLFLFVFSMNSGVPFTVNSGGEYIGLTFVGLFALTFQDRSFGRLMRWFYILCCGYAVFYLMASGAIRLGIIDTGGITRAIASADDAGRGDRLHAAALLLVFGTAYSVAQMRLRFAVPYLLAAGLFAIAWWVTESRAITTVTFLVMVGYVALRNVPLMGRAAFLAYLAGTLFSILLLIDPSLNPFLYFGDQSASIRVNSVDIASQSMQYYWLTGAGISFGVENYRPLTGITYFFPGDIGMMGIFYMYGVAGLMIYMFISYLGCHSYWPVLKLGYSAVLAEAVTLTAIVLALYSLQAPQYNGGSSGSIFAMMLIALALQPRQAQAIPRPR